MALLHIIKQSAYIELPEKARGRSETVANERRGQYGPGRAVRQKMRDEKKFREESLGIIFEE